MAQDRYDAIVVGARCAGSPTAMLLARKGYRVLVVDRATFPSDTLSTHILHPPGGGGDAAMGPARPPGRRRDARRSTRTRSTSGRSRSRARRAPRPLRWRTALDAPCSTSCSSTRHPRPAPRSARGSPWRRSSSRTVESSASAATARTGRRSPSTPTWWSGRTDGTRSSRRRSIPSSTTRSRRCSAATTPTGAACRWTAASRCTSGPAVASRRRPRTTTSRSWSRAGRTRSSRPTRRMSRATTCKTFDLVPEFAERIRGATREARFAGTAVPNYFRRPYGPGWALVGDAGYNKDFITAQGILDAFRDAELCATALDAVVLRRAFLRRSDGRLPVHPRRARAADVRVHLPAGDPRAAAARDAGSCWGRRTATRRHGRVRPRERRRDVTGRVLLRGERRPDLRRGSGTVGGICTHRIARARFADNDGNPARRCPVCFVSLRADNSFRRRSECSHAAATRRASRAGSTSSSPISTPRWRSTAGCSDGPSRSAHPMAPCPATPTRASTDSIVAGVGGAPAAQRRSRGMDHLHLGRLGRRDGRTGRGERRSGDLGSRRHPALRAGGRLRRSRRARCSGCGRPRDNRGAELVNAPGSWNFSELNVRDTKEASAFYGAVFGWLSDSLEMGDRTGGGDVAGARATATSWPSATRDPRAPGRRGRARWLRRRRRLPDPVARRVRHRGVLERHVRRCRRRRRVRPGDRAGRTGDHATVRHRLHPHGHGRGSAGRRAQPQPSTAHRHPTEAAAVSSWSTPAARGSRRRDGLRSSIRRRCARARRRSWRRHGGGRSPGARRGAARRDRRWRWRRRR